MKYALILALLLCPVLLGAQTFTQRENGDLRVEGSNYTADFSASGGCLSGLTVRRTQFMEQERYYGWIKEYRPCFFTASAGLLDEDAPASVSLDGSSVICTTPSLGTAVFEMKDDHFTVRAKNTSAAPVNYIMAFSGRVRCIEADWKPVTENRGGFRADAVKWVLEHAVVGVEGASLWEPYSYSARIARLDLEPGQEKSLRFFFVPASVKETETAYRLGLPAMELPEFDLASPCDWQVFQRRDRLSGPVLFSGRVPAGCDSIRYRITGKDLRGKKVDTGRKAIKVKDGFFCQKVSCPAGGWYRVDIEALEKGRPLWEKTLEHVGVGEVFVGAGQSNSTNWGQFFAEQESGMVSATDGVTWRKAEGPMPGVHEGSSGGSYYPSLGDLIYKEFNVPVGIASAGHGGSAIIHWKPDWMLYRHFIGRVRDLGPGGFRAVLWHQGEADYGREFNAALTDMIGIIQASRKDAGWYVPWFVAQVSYNNEEAASGPIRNVHKALWDLGIALEGPDTDTLTGKMRDYDGKGVHLSPEGLREHGRLWAEKLIPYIRACIGR
ncbi:MAG: hypothetical protein ILO36_04695 [Abditibacteriota bacterium]|nr:hypothetical protein [Abditibacteriota bacterium]